MDGSIGIRRIDHGGCVVLSLAGRLDLAAAPQVQAAILRELAEQPRAVICDLGQVESLDPVCAGVFTSIRHPALGWPGTALALCGARPAVADTLARVGVASRLAIHPSLDQALRNTCARPSALREHLTLEPVPTAAGTGRNFVREVCRRWGVQELADPATLLASQLVTNALVHAGTTMELRMELRGQRLSLAVSDQDPNLRRLLAARQGVDRGRGLLILDQVATAWGVRRNGTGGKVVWCTLELPAGRTIGDDSGPVDRPGPELVTTKLVAPAPRAGLIVRAGLLALLQGGLAAKLCLLDAPAGSGKTTLLAQWRAAAGGSRVAWVSLDEGDNDPTRFWTYVVQALRTVEPGMAETASQALLRRGVDLQRVVLPSLLNELSQVGTPLVLVLDDYHLITNTSCHQILDRFLEHLPAGVHVVLATRADPPLRLAAMRARGELAELRVADMQFSDEEASALLNGTMGLELTAGDVARLAERTEGWAAGLVLAGLSLRDRRDPGGFIDAFQGTHRHVADYLAAEVLERQPEPVRRFLLRTSVLERLSGPLCDAVLETRGSAERLEELERSNLFLVPLDDRREWYRYHQLFGELLRLELGTSEPALVPTLHQRAAAWHRAAGQVDEAIGHSIAAGRFSEANAVIARHWLRYWRRGQRATVVRWLDGLPEEAVLADPPVAYVAAWIGGFSGASKQQVEGWLAATEDKAWEGPLPDGIGSLAFGAALARAAAIFDDVGRSLAAARRARELAGPAPSPNRWMAEAALGHALYLSGRPADAHSALEELVRRVPPAAQPYAVITALAVGSLVAGDEDDATGEALARRAVAVAEDQGLTGEPLSGLAYLALGQALAGGGRLTQAEEQLERALELYQIDSMALHRAHALLALARVRHRRGDLQGALALVDRAGRLVEGFADPGVLPVLLGQARQSLDRTLRRQVAVAAPLTERELTVLRWLPTRLSTPEIAGELSVSVATVRSQVQAIYRKLQVGNRAEAVTRARQLGLLPRAGPVPRA